MKKNFILVVILLVYGITNAQTALTLDQQIVNVNQTSVTSGIIYERVSQYANLYNFNKSTDFNVADFKYFKQSLSEMYRASNSTKFTSLTNFKNLINGTTLTNEVDIAILSTQFHVLNYNKDDVSLGGLTYNETTQKYSQISGKVPFYMLDNTVVSTSKDYVSGTSITYKLRNDLFFKNGTKTIKTLVADFGDGVNRTLINNGVLTNQSITVNYNASGDKKSKYTITYNDNSTLITFSTIYFRYFNSSANLVSSVSSSCGATDPLRQDFSLQADIPFTGFVAGDPTIKAKIDYRVFYSNGNTQKLVKKPIVIIDGFDPGDKRKIEDCDCENDAACSARNTSNGVFDGDKHRAMVDMMIYKDNLGLDRNLLPELRALGYDIIMVNQPTYTTTNIQNGQTVTIDGGAYYIESNAMAMVKLISQVRQLLIANNSTSQIAIVGPSMGGQISRYALAYMEKNSIPHNVFLWVSVDSPHLGANIPMGDQALINLLKTESTAAEDFYDKELSSPASQEQLIEFHREGSDYNTVNQTYLNGQTVSQGLTSNSGNSFYQQHYNNQNSNGLPGSHGFPINLRKISLVNGSVTGKTFGSNSENVLTIKAFERVHIPLLIGQYSFSVHLATMEADFMPAIGTSAQIAYFNKKGSTKNTISPNLNLRGNMDIVPGGFFAAQNDINQSITGQGVFQTRGSFWQFTMDNLIYFLTSINGSGGYWETREFKPIHSFIPSFSSIAHKQPNQNWGNRLDRNLVCSNETYFDSYFGHDENTQHTSFDYDSVTWLKKELAGQPQAPYFPIQAGLLTGDNTICNGVNKTYTITDICKVPSQATFSVQGNLVIVGSNTGYSVTIQGTSNTGSTGTITATFQNGQTITKTVNVGAPNLTNIDLSLYGVFGWYYTGIASGASASVSAVPTATSYRWQIDVDAEFAPTSTATIPTYAKFTTNGSTVTVSNSGGVITSTPAICTTATPTVSINFGNYSADYVVSCYAVNACGETPYYGKYVQLSKSSPCNGTNVVSKFAVSPNPVKSDGGTITVNIAQNQLPCDPPITSSGKTASFSTDNTKVVKIFDMQGNQMFENKYNEEETFTIKGINLKSGYYILNITFPNGQSDKEIIIIE